ncbi:MAG: CTL/SLC44 family protein [Asgard group archaeon]|nr:CTL/SLC44 family protein [Asgard group archaeon]
MTPKGKIDLQPANIKAILAYIITSLIFFGVGILCFILFWRSDTTSGTETYGELISNGLNDLISSLISGGTIQQYWWIILLIFVGLVVLGFIVGWFLLFLVSKLGHILVYAGVAFYIVGAVVGGIVGMFMGAGVMSFLSLAPAVVLIIGLFTNIRKFKRAGEFMKFTGSVVLAEKGMVIAPIFVSIVSMINFFTMASIFAYLVILFYDGSGLEWLGYIIGALASFLQLIVYYGIFYVAESINTTYAYEWYRKRDPDMKFCVKNVSGKFGPIFTFGVVSALVRWLQNMLRNSAASAKGNAAGIILAILARAIAAIIGFVFKYLTYFTLPAIVIEGTKFKDGVSRSFSLLKRYYMDVLIRETGVERAMGLTQLISCFIYGLIGVIVGLVIKLSYPSITWTTAMLVTVIPMVIFGFIPTFFIFRPMKTAYLTFVFAYAQDEEEGFRLPTRMPAELRGDMKDARSTMDTSKSIAAVAEKF